MKHQLLEKFILTEKFNLQETLTPDQISAFKQVVSDIQNKVRDLFINTKSPSLALTIPAKQVLDFDLHTLNQEAAAQLPANLIVQARDLRTKLISYEANTNNNINDRETKLTQQALPLLNDLNTYFRKVTAQINKAKFQANKQARDDSEMRDWEAQYEDCKTKEEFESFWDNYFKVEWQADNTYLKVMNLGYAFINELQKFGFNEVTNPFITFLRGNSDPAKWRINTFNINKDNYAILHNSYTSGWIRAADLCGKGTFERHNIIFNKSLYNLDSGKMRDYLELQFELKKFMEGYAPLDIRDFYKGGLRNRAIVLDNLMYKVGNLDNLMSARIVDAVDIKVAQGQEIEFRPITEIKMRMKQFEDSSTQQEKSATEADADTFVSRANSATEAANMLVFCLDYFRVNFADYITSFLSGNSSNTEFIKALNAAHPTQKDKTDYAKWLQASNVKYDNVTVVSNLLTNLATKALDVGTNGNNP